MKVTSAGSSPIANSNISPKANKTLEAKATKAIAGEFLKRNPGATNIKVQFPKFEGAAASSPRSLFEHYNFMNANVTGKLPSGKTVTAHPRYFNGDGKVMWGS
jgi:hypothetical protein